jgi:hypothetical protein
MISALPKENAKKGGVATDASFWSTSEQFKKYVLKHLFSKIHTMTMHIKLWQQHCNVLRPCNLAGLEHCLLCSGGGRDDQMSDFLWFGMS